MGKLNLQMLKMNYKGYKSKRTFFPDYFNGILNIRELFRENGKVVWFHKTP